jgi:hypothetical protein
MALKILQDYMRSSFFQKLNRMTMLRVVTAILKSASSTSSKLKLLTFPARKEVLQDFFLCVLILGIEDLCEWFFAHRATRSSLARLQNSSNMLWLCFWLCFDV